MNALEKKVNESVKTDLWEYLKKNDKSIIIYGMGNGADKIINTFRLYNIEYSDIFASDGFVRGQKFKGKTVLTYNEIINKYGNDIIIVVAFGSKLPDVIRQIQVLSSKHELYIPDVPVFGNTLFTYDFYKTHSEDFFNVYNFLADERSKEVYENIIKYKLSGKFGFLQNADDQEQASYFLLQTEKYRYIADLGAYTGDTVKRFLELFPHIKEISAFEPDIKNYNKLVNNTAQYDNCIIKNYNFASGNEDRTVFINSSSNKNSTLQNESSYHHKSVQVEERKIDSVIEKADFIKYDVEGYESEALEGSQRIIKEQKPDLLVSLYHKSEDLFSLPLSIKNLYNGYSLYIRKSPCFPAWDLNLIAINK